MGKSCTFGDKMNFEEEINKLKLELNLCPVGIGDKYKIINDFKKTELLFNDEEWVEFLEIYSGRLGFKLKNIILSEQLMDLHKITYDLEKFYTNEIYRFQNNAFDVLYEYLVIIYYERLLGITGQIGSEFLTILQNKALPCSKNVVYKEKI